MKAGALEYLLGRRGSLRHGKPSQPSIVARTTASPSPGEVTHDPPEPCTEGNTLRGPATQRGGERVLYDVVGRVRVAHEASREAPQALGVLREASGCERRGQGVSPFTGSRRAPFVSRARPMPSLRCASLSALRARERLFPTVLKAIANWSAGYGAAHGGVTPDPMDLRGQDFDHRVGSKWGADKAARNASCYPGGRSGRPSYSQIFHEVWVERRWPDLCEALAGG